MKTENRDGKEQSLKCREVEVCLACRTIYKLEIVSPGENSSDFGIRFCPHCGSSTESLPVAVVVKTQDMEDNFFALITISGGLIDQVKFYQEPLIAMSALSIFMKTINPENEDAGVYGKDGLVVNAKSFLI